jgi:general stress protein 26
MDKEKNLEKVIELIKNDRICMLTTKQVDGMLKSRPMYVNQIEEDGTLWFFNNEYSCKANEIKENPEINLAFTNNNDKTYISISGEAEISENEEKMKDLMNPAVKAWFPEGLDDSSISLLKVNLEKAAYWITEKDKLQRVFEYTKAIVKGKKPNISKQQTVEA